jgi:hypothetical protein
MRVKGEHNLSGVARRAEPEGSPLRFLHCLCESLRLFGVLFFFTCEFDNGGAGFFIQKPPKTQFFERFRHRNSERIPASLPIVDIDEPAQLFFPVSHQQFTLFADRYCSQFFRIFVKTCRQVAVVEFFLHPVELIVCGADRPVGNPVM